MLLVPGMSNCSNLIRHSYGCGPVLRAFGPCWAWPRAPCEGIKLVTAISESGHVPKCQPDAHRTTLGDHRADNVLTRELIANTLAPVNIMPALT